MQSPVPDRPPHHWRPQVRRASELVREFLDINAEFAGHVADVLEVNPTDLQAMQHLMMSGSLSPTELAGRLGLSTAATTTVVDRLVAIGHATREQHPTDRRSVMVVPRPQSVERAMSTLMPVIMGIDRVLDGFDEQQQATITEYLQRVVNLYRAQLP